MPKAIIVADKAGRLIAFPCDVPLDLMEHPAIRVKPADSTGWTEAVRVHECPLVYVAMTAKGAFSEIHEPHGEVESRLTGWQPSKVPDSLEEWCNGTPTK